MKILEIREKPAPLKDNISNAYINFSQMTVSIVAIVTDVVRDGKRVIGYGFNSNGRYGQGALMRERPLRRDLRVRHERRMEEGEGQGEGQHRPEHVPHLRSPMINALTCDTW